VARCVHDVDAGFAPQDRRGLGKNGDAALALQVVGIHRPLDLALVVPVGAGLLQQAINQGGLAVVDVGDDGDIAKHDRSKPIRAPRGPVCGIYRQVVHRPQRTICGEEGLLEAVIGR